MKERLDINSSVRAIDFSELKIFLEGKGREIPPLGKNLQSFGLFQQDKLIGGALVCNPRMNTLQRSYTAEFVELFVIEEKSFLTGVENLLKHFMKTGAWDFFAHENVFGGSSKVPEVLEKSQSKLSDEQIYHWRNPKVWFYTYKISSAIDDGYYYGRHLIRGENPSLEDCLRDGYMGSGGKKYRAWRTWVGDENLMKTVISIYSSWEEVVVAEEELIGDKNLMDPHCKNFQPGGIGITRFISNFSLKNCSIHGETIHLGFSCRKCSSEGSKSFRRCSIHGLAKHQGNRCKTCVAEQSYSSKECSFHGLVPHRGDSCCSCSSIKPVGIGVCVIHGEVKMISGKCKVCMAKNSLGIKICEKHGESNHQGNSCIACVSSKAIQLRTCLTHGVTKHRGSSCYRCSQKSAIVTGVCSTHGEVTFQGESCTKCVQEKIIKLKNCSIHGETKHQGNRCRKCLVQKSIGIRLCDIHGEVNHRGDKCMKCSAQKTKTTKAARKNQ